MSSALSARQKLCLVESCCNYGDALCLWSCYVFGLPYYYLFDFDGLDMDCPIIGLK
jgi:hypothetical protein